MFKVARFGCQAGIEILSGFRVEDLGFWVVRVSDLEFRVRV